LNDVSINRLVGFPLPGTARATVAVAAPSAGRGYWAGAPSAALDEDGSYVLAYRLKHGLEGRRETIVARSDDGERFTTVATLGQERFGASSVERPSLVRSESGGWLLYVCCATPGTKHWWIGLLEADDPSGFTGSDVRGVFPGDERTGVKDPVVRHVAGGFEAWICCHPLDEPDEEDRMTTAYATSRDGVDWRWHGTALAGRPGLWDARGARVTGVLLDGRASYDGRATKEENWLERTGLARRVGTGGRLEPEGKAPVSDARYLDVVALPDVGYRIYYEAPLPDGSHELRTELEPFRNGL
jgi:hypothetical protein